MSLFESVFVKLACERCGKVHDSFVRFRSYSGRADAEYELMEVASRRDGLSTGEVWEGNADRYCEKCYFAWSIAQASAAYEALAELVEKGLVTARAKGPSAQAEESARAKESAQTKESSTSLLASAIAAYAEKYVSKLVKQKCIMATMPYFEEFELTVENKPVEDVTLPITDEPFDGYPVWSEFLLLIDPLLSDRMKQAGWVADGSTWEDFHVSLDDKRRVVVQDLQGRTLTRDGTRVPQ
jgi:hypothetical protein